MRPQKLRQVNSNASLLCQLIDVICTKRTYKNFTFAALRHAATSPNIYNDVILPNVLTKYNFS